MFDDIQRDNRPNIAIYSETDYSVNKKRLQEPISIIDKLKFGMLNFLFDKIEKILGDSIL